MIVQCGQCQSRFKIADEKVTDKGVRVRCTKCQNVFRVSLPPKESPLPEPAPPDERFSVPEPPSPSTRARETNANANAASSDPFGSLDLGDSSLRAPAPEDPSFGNVSFDDGASGPDPFAGGGPSQGDGLELDLDRSAIEKPQPPPIPKPAPVPAAAPVPSEPAPAPRPLAADPTPAPRPAAAAVRLGVLTPPRPIQAASARAASPSLARLAGAWAFQVAAAAALLVLLAGVGLAYLNEGKLERAALSVARLRRLFAPREMVARDISNGLYETERGKPVFYVRGEVENRSGRRGKVRVRAEILDGEQLVRAAEGYAGATASPEELYAISSASDLDALVARLSQGAVEVAAGARAPFLVAFYEYPLDLSSYRLSVKVLEPGGSP